MSEAIDPAPHWKVRVTRRGSGAFVPAQPAQPDLLEPAPPREFGVRYLAALEGAAQLLHGADAVAIERNPPLGPPILFTIAGAPAIGIPADGDTLTIGDKLITFHVSETPPLAGPPALKTEP